MSHRVSVATFGFLALLTLPLLLVVLLPAPQLSIALIPVVLILLYSSSHLARISASSAQHIATTTFWLFVYMFLGVCPLLQVSTGTFPSGGNYSDQLLVKTGFVVVAGLIAFDIGRYLLGSARGAAIPKALQRPIDKRTVVILSTTALLSAVYFVQTMGGLAILFLPRFQFSKALASHLDLPEILLLGQLAKTPAYVLLIATIAVWIGRHSKKLRVGVGWKAMVFVLFVATLVLNNPISTPRLKVGTIFLSLFFVLPWRRWSAAITVGGLILGLVVVFPFADLFRNSLEVSLSARLAETSPIKELTKNGDFDAFQMVANTVDVMETSDFNLGRQIGGALLFWVPRAVWPSKPIPTGEWVAKQKGYTYTNVSAPLWAEFYVDGGWVLLIFGFVAYGYVVRTIDRWYALANQTPQARVVSVLVPIYAGYQFFLLRGALMPAVAFFAPILICALLCSVRLTISRSRHTVASLGNFG